MSVMSFYLITMSVIHLHLNFFHVKVHQISVPNPIIPYTDLPKIRSVTSKTLYIVSNAAIICKQGIVNLVMSLLRSVAWHSGRTSVCWPANFPCPALDLLLTGDQLMWVKRPLYRSANQANSAFHPFGVDR